MHRPDLSSHRRWLPFAALLLLAAIWGYNWVVMKIALRYAQPFTFSAYWRVWENMQSLIDRRIDPLELLRDRARLNGWSKATPTGLHRPFVVAAHHPAWGADLARQAGASPHTVELIRQHHDPQPTDDPLVAALKAADDIN